MSRFVDDQGQGLVDGASATSVGELVLPQEFPRDLLGEFDQLPGAFAAITLRPTPLSHRYAYDRYAAGFSFDLPTDIAPTAMNSTQLQNINREANLSALTLTCPLNTDVIYVGLVFNELVTLSHYMIVSGGDIGHWTSIQTSLNTTNGFDGSWTTIDSTTAAAWEDGLVNPQFRTRAATLIGAANIRGIRFLHTGDVSIDIYALHLYGGPGSSATTTRLAVWDPTLDQAAGTDVLNFGDMPRSSSKDLKFRIKNLSAADVATATSVALESLTDPGAGPDTHTMGLLSEDGGVTFAAAIVVGSLAPGEISDQIILRMVIPSNADTGTWCARAVCSAGGGVAEVTEYLYLGDVSVGTPIPHIWYVYPPSEFSGALVTLVGQGFGSSQPVYNGIARYGAASATVGGWSQTAAGAHAYDAQRAIQSANDVVNVEHQRVVVSVPSPAVDDYFTVVTDA